MSFKIGLTGHVFVNLFQLVPLRSKAYTIYLYYNPLVIEISKELEFDLLIILLYLTVTSKMFK